MPNRQFVREDGNGFGAHSALLPSTGSGQAGQALRGNDNRVVCGHIIRVAFESAADIAFDYFAHDKLRSKGMSIRTDKVVINRDQ